ncbi:MAG: hypothetical protein IPL35_08230 [Sphingobacteriales bacterium]|nr:hypothetical protein [Sphingobacteriales bacterium]
MSLQIITISHHKATLNELGQWIVNEQLLSSNLAEHLQYLKNQHALNGLWYVATCNRILFVLSGDAPAIAHLSDDTAHFWRNYHPQLSPADIETMTQKSSIYHDAAAVEHLYEVAASVDALVVGEREILRQLRQSYEVCRQAGLIDDTLRLLSENTVNVAKQVYTDTKIGENPVSVVSLALKELNRHHLAHDAKILMVGAGQTMHLVAKLLRAQGYHHFTVFNRTTKNQAIGTLLNIPIQPLSRLAHYREGFDLLVTCVGNSENIIDETLFAALRGDSTAPAYIIDLAIPANISPEVSKQETVHYIAIEKLRDLAHENLNRRRQEIQHAKQIIHAHVKTFSKKKPPTHFGVGNGGNSPKDKSRKK